MSTKNAEEEQGQRDVYKTPFPDGSVSRNHEYWEEGKSSTTTAMYNSPVKDHR
jgi:hypothetical protein